MISVLRIDNWNSLEKIRFSVVWLSIQNDVERKTNGRKSKMLTSNRKEFVFFLIVESRMEIVLKLFSFVTGERNENKHSTEDKSPLCWYKQVLPWWFVLLWMATLLRYRDSVTSLSDHNHKEQRKFDLFDEQFSFLLMENRSFGSVSNRFVEFQCSPMKLSMVKPGPLESVSKDRVVRLIWEENSFSFRKVKSFLRWVLNILTFHRIFGRTFSVTQWSL